MADYQFNTDLTPKIQGTNLGDMINMARGVQQYQQAEQVNPELVQQAQTNTKKGQFELEANQNNLINHTLSVLSLSPVVQAGKDGKAIAHEIAIQRENLIRSGVPREKIDLAAAHLMTTANQAPDKMMDVLGNLRRSAMTPEQVQATVSGQERVEGADIYGNPLKTVTNPNTGVKYQAPLPYAGDGANMRYAPGESSKTLEAMQAEREAAKNQAAAVSPALQNITSIRQALKSAQTGRGSEAIANLQSVFGNLAGSTAEEKAAAARDIIEKNIADLALQKNAALGGKFAADLDGAQKSLASAGRNPTAISKALDQLEPLIQHVSLYQQGLEKAIVKNNGNVQVKRQFDNEMLKAYDVQALMAYNAYKSGDKKAFESAISGMSKDKKDKLFSNVERYAKLSNGEL
jgi:hypothetical protein